MNFEPGALLIDFGVLAVFIVIVGGGLEVFGVKAPVIGSSRRQLILFAVGVALAVAGAMTLPAERLAKITLKFTRNGRASDQGEVQRQQALLAPVLQDRGWHISDNIITWSTPIESPKPDRGLYTQCSLPVVQINGPLVTANSKIVNQQKVYYACEISGIVPVARAINIRTIAASALPLPLPVQEMFEIK